MAQTYKRPICTMEKENNKKVQQKLRILPKRTLKSTHIIDQNLNTCEKNTSSSLQKNCKANRKLNEIQTPNLIKKNCKTMLKDDLQEINHLHNRSKISCNLCGKTFCSNKTLKQHQKKIKCTLNVELQETGLSRFDKKSPKQKYLEVETCKPHKGKQSNSNIQNIINSKCVSDCDFSLKVERESNCKISNSITTEGSKSIYTKDKKQRTVKSCHLGIKKRKQVNILFENTIHKYKQHINKIEKSKCFRSAVEKENTNNFSEITILQQNKTDIKVNKPVTENKNCLNVKPLVIPLIKIEDLPLSELSKLIQTPKYDKKKLKIQENRSIYYETKNIIEDIPLSESSKLIQTSNYGKKKLKIQENKSIYYETKNITEDLPLSQSSKLIQTSNYGEKKLEIQENKSIYYEIKNIKETQYSVYEEYRTTGVKQNEEINELHHKSMLKKKVETNICKMTSENKVCNKKTLENNECKSQTTYLLQNILQFFLRNKRCLVYKKTRQRLRNMNLRNTDEFKIRKSIAICNKCNEIFNLLQQFSNKVNFVQDEKLCIECTLCNLQISSLSHFQEHVMDVHLQCEGTLHDKKGKHAVFIINFNEQLNLSNKDQYIFECCCCLKIFKHIADFEKHIKKLHYSSNYCTNNTKQQETKQIVNTSESCTALTNEQIFIKDNTLNKNYIFDITTNLPHVSNVEKETGTQNNNHIDQYCINTEEMNFKNDMYHNNSYNENLLLKMEVKQKQIKNTEHSNITEIMKTVAKTDGNIEKLKINQEYSNSITIISESNLPTTSNNNIYQIFKNCERYKQNSFFVCNICFKKYKREDMFLIHMSKHMTDSLVTTNEKQKPQEDNNMISGSNLPITSNDNIDQIFKNCDRYKHNSPFVCNICFKKYKRERAFLIHMSKHTTDSLVNTNEKQKPQEDNNMISESNLSTTFNGNIDQIFKNCDRYKHNSFFVCNICFKKYKRERAFLIHMCKHTTDSLANTNEKQKPQEDNIISGSNLPTTSNDNMDEIIKNCDRYKQNSFFVCNICFKKYKIEHTFLIHMSKHTTDSLVNTNEKQKPQEDNNMISGSNLPTTPNDNMDEIIKNCDRYKQNSFFVCNICFKKYKIEHTFLMHMSKHTTDSLVDTNKEQEPQEDNNIISLKNDLIILNDSTKNTQDYTSGFKDSNILNSSINLESPNKSILISEIIDNEVDNVKNDNKDIEYMTKEDSVTSETDISYNSILHINLIQNTKNGTKRQKSIKFNINITKRYKRDFSEQNNIQNEIENMFRINLLGNISFVRSSNTGNISCGLRELQCYICHKRFSTLTILKEHMFFLHDTMFEGPELSNLPIIPYFNSYHNTQNLSMKNTPISKEKYNASFRTKLSKKVLQNENKIHGKTIHQMFNINKMNKKWRCNPCKENFALLRNYLRHKYYCHNDESVVHICDNCNKILTSVAMVNIHMCTNVTSWTCNRCNINFSSGKFLTQHNMKYHIESVGPHICKVCKLSFLTSYMLTKHEATHSINEVCNNFDNFLNLSTKSHLSYAEHNTNVNNNVNEKRAHLINDSTIDYINEEVKILNQLDELNNKLSEMQITSNIQHSNEEILKCKHCNILCPTKLQLKLHLEKWHKEEMCQICNNLYPTDKLMKHLMCHHIVSDSLCFDENNANIQVTSENIAFQNDIIKILGLKRLLSLYEYQRFNNIIENKYFDCIICSKQFSSIECYKIHYLKYHDTICLLCNIKFKYTFQAFEHKIKIHKSVNSYLWIVQKLIFAVLELNEYGNTIEEAILKCSEIRIH